MTTNSQNQGIANVGEESALAIEFIDTREGFQQLRQAWDAVYRVDCEGQIFLSWQWLERLYDRRDEPVFILACRTVGEAAHYVAFLPLRPLVKYSERRKQFYNSYCLAGNYWADYTGVLCHPHYEIAALPLLGEALAQRRWRRLVLESMRISDRRLSLLLHAIDRKTCRIETVALTDNGGATNLNVAPRIDLPDSIEDYLDTCVSSNMRQKLRRFRRRLVEESSLSIRVSSVVTLEQDLCFFRDHWKRRWSTVKGVRTQTLADKYEDIIRPATVYGEIWMPVLLDSGRPVALLACYVDHDKRSLLFYVAARDQQFDRLPGGLMLHVHAIEWAISQGFKHYDLLRGDEPYKYDLGARDQSLVTLRITAQKLAGDALFLDESGKRDVLQKLERVQSRARASTVHALYAQVLESWPGESSVLEQYATWLERTSQHAHAESIRATLYPTEMAVM